jgi:hypothetical protein
MPLVPAAFAWIKESHGFTSLLRGINGRVRIRGPSTAAKAVSKRDNIDFRLTSSSDVLCRGISQALRARVHGGVAGSKATLPTRR